MDIDAWLADYRKKKGSKDEKYSLYRQKMASSGKPEWKTIQGALDLLKETQDPRILKILRSIEKRRIVFVMDELGFDHGKIHENGDWDKKSEKYDNSVIVIDKRYIGNYIGIAGVIAHEYRHILDCEEHRWAEKGSRKKRHEWISLGDYGNGQGLNDERSQIRANSFAGGILNLLGWIDSETLKNMHPDDLRKLIKKKKNWGPKWFSTDNSILQAMDGKSKLGREFESRKGRIKKKRCGRITFNFGRYGYCDREVANPPCWDHY
jgi:hypothetical protein